MKVYEFTVRQTLSMVCRVKANSEAEAHHAMEELKENGHFIMSQDFGNDLDIDCTKTQDAHTNHDDYDYYVIDGMVV